METNQHQGEVEVEEARNMSVAALQQRLDSGEATSNQRNALLAVNRLTPVVTERFAPNWDGLGPISRLRYGTMLHAACHDRDGIRGEAKIRILLKTAASCSDRMISKEMLTVGEVWRDVWNRNIGTPRRIPNVDGTQCCALHALLLDNPHSTVESVRLLVSAWPDVVHMRGPCNGDDGEYNDNMLSKFIRTYATADDPQRLVAVCTILLEAAATTRFGAKGMLSTVSFRWQKEPSPGPLYSKWMESSSSYPNTPLEVVLKKVAGGPLYQLVQLFLQHWPDALTFYCQEHFCAPHYSNIDFHPLTTVANDHTRFSRHDQLELLQAFLRRSSVQALAQALIRADRTGCSGFQAMQGILDKTHRRGGKDDPTAENEEAGLLDQVLRCRHDLVFRKDAHGRTLLHYLSADAMVFPYEPIRDEGSKSLWMHRENSRMERIGTVARWILTVDKKAFSVRDKQGRNYPLQFAVIQGKGWETGLKSMLETDELLVPGEVLCDRTRDGLYPFMLAATVESLYDQLGTIFELLRRNPELIHG